jgi:hypothetical protein
MTEIEDVKEVNQKTCYLDVDLHSKFKSHCAIIGQSMFDTLNQIVKDYMNKQRA